MSRKLVPGKLVIASHNAGKVREIRDLLAPYGIEPTSAGELGLAEPEENGSTFEANALTKAHAAAKAANLPALADDSGISVAALGGAPGVYTADWAEMHDREGGPGRNWYMAMGKVEGRLVEMGPDVDRSAWFTCVLAIAWPDGDEAVYKGEVHGSLAWPPRGTMGFGYDPVFVPKGDTRTFAEHEPSEKHGISHRAKAFAKLVEDQFGS